jgi:hypothetical protein
MEHSVHNDGTHSADLLYSFNSFMGEILVW